MQALFLFFWCLSSYGFFPFCQKTGAGAPLPYKHLSGSVQDHSDCAVHAGVVAQHRQLEGDLLAGRKGIGYIILGNGVQKDLACPGYAAADDDHVGIHHTGDGSRGLAQHTARELHDGDSRLVSCLGRVEDVLAGDGINVQKRRFGGRCQHFLGPADDAGTSGEEIADGDSSEAGTGVSGTETGEDGSEAIDTADGTGLEGTDPEGTGPEGTDPEALAQREGEGRGKLLGVQAV